jgi:hypothetical protein
MMKLVVFIICGGISGAILSYSLGMKSARQLSQGFAGGAISGILMALMLPG